MTKKLIVSSESSNLYTSHRFISEGKRLKLNTIHLNPYETIQSSLDNLKQQEGIYLFRTTGIRFDDFDIRLAEQYMDAGLNVVNSLKSLPTFREKDAQIHFLKNNKFHFIPTINFRGSITPQLINALEKLSKDETYIVKMNRGNGGIGVQIIRGLDSLLSILETYHALKDQRLIIQPYLKHKKEYRIFASKKCIWAMIEKQILNEDFRGNSKRSKATLKKHITVELSELIQNILESSGLDYIGVDLFYDNQNRPIILEVNAIPGFKQIEELSKINIARELIIEFNNYSK